MADGQSGVKGWAAETDRRRERADGDEASRYHDGRRFL